MNNLCSNKIVFFPLNIGLKLIMETQSIVEFEFHLVFRLTQLNYIKLYKWVVWIKKLSFFIFFCGWQMDMHSSKLMINQLELWAKLINSMCEYINRRFDLQSRSREVKCVFHGFHWAQQNPFLLYLASVRDCLNQSLQFGSVRLEKNQAIFHQCWMQNVDHEMTNNTSHFGEDNCI